MKLALSHSEGPENSPQTPAHARGAYLDGRPCDALGGMKVFLSSGYRPVVSGWERDQSFAVAMAAALDLLENDAAYEFAAEWKRSATGNHRPGDLAPVLYGRTLVEVGDARAGLSFLDRHAPEAVLESAGVWAGFLRANAGLAVWRAGIAGLAELSATAARSRALRLLTPREPGNSPEVLLARATVLLESEMHGYVGGDFMTAAPIGAGALNGPTQLLEAVLTSIPRGRHTASQALYQLSLCLQLKGVSARSRAALLEAHSIAAASAPESKWTRLLRDEVLLAGADL